MHKFVAIVFALFLTACGTESVDAFDTEMGLRNPNTQACGGFAGLQCPDGYTCVDDRSDDCDPNNGGADCIGTCKRGGPQGNNGNGQCDHQPNEYVAYGDQCFAIMFICAEGTEYFFDDCGCGCTATEPEPAGEQCGDNVCGAGMVCCNSSCGICTEPGGFCTQQACEGTTTL